MTAADTAKVWRSWRAVPLVALGGAVVLLAAGVIAGYFGERLYQSQKTREVGVQAGILADTVNAAVVFGDVEAAKGYVSALRANPEIETAGVYDARGVLMAGYQRAGSALPREVVGTHPARFEGAYLIVTKPITAAGETVGTVHLRATVEPLSRRFSRYGVTALLIGMAALLVGVLATAQAVLSRANNELRRHAEELDEANHELRVQIEEREKAEEALRHSQKMEAIGQLTGGVAHDFNNLLMVASSGLELMERTTDPERREVLRESIRQAVDRGASLTRQLLAFSRRAALKPAAVDLAAHVSEMGVLLERSLRENIEVEFDLAGDLWPVEIDPQQLELTILNVCVNARDAMPDGGTIVISARNAPALDDGALEGDFVRLSITDTGRGMDADTIARVFEPFFTTKERGQGTGLGLSQVYGFTRASGGDVRIDSRPGEGTTVSLLLPRSARAAAAPSADARAHPPRGHGRVLLVEDDDDVASVVGEMLRELGYEPERAASGSEALKVLDAADSFDLVFSDMVMPGKIDGIGLAREIRRKRPGLPVVLTTGFSEAAEAANQDHLRLLVKPYRIEQLAAELEAARNDPRAAG